MPFVEPNCYFTITGSSFHNSKGAQERRSILDSFQNKVSNSSEKTIISQSSPFLNVIITSNNETRVLQHQRFSVDNVKN